MKAELVALFESEILKHQKMEILLRSQNVISDDHHRIELLLKVAMTVLLEYGDENITELLKSENYF